MRFEKSSLVRTCFLFFSVLVSCVVVHARQQNSQLITLDEAIETALQKNAVLEASREAMKISGYRLKKAKLDLLPKADVQLNYARLDPGTVRRSNVFVEAGRELVRGLNMNPDLNVGDPNDIRPTAYDNSFSTMLNVVQPIYNGGANWAAIGLARAEEQSSGHLLDDTKQQVILETRRSYFRVLQAEELRALAQRSLAASEEHLKNARNMLSVGLRSKTDVLRWEVQKAASEGQVIETENVLTVAYAALKHVMGVSFDKEIRALPVLEEPMPLDGTIADQFEKIRFRHPRMQAVAASVDVARSGVRLASAAFQPKLNFVYQLGWEQNNTVALDSFSFWTAGLRLNMPLFHSFSNVARLQERKAAVRRLEQTEVESERLLMLELIQVRANVETAYKKFKIAGKAVQQARENLRVLNNTYAVGLAANIDVLDGQVALTDSETQRIRARYDYWIAKAELQRAEGSLSEKSD